MAQARDRLFCRVERADVGGGFQNLVEAYWTLAQVLFRVLAVGKARRVEKLAGGVVPGVAPLERQAVAQARVARVEPLSDTGYTGVVWPLKAS